MTPARPARAFPRHGVCAVFILLGAAAVGNSGRSALCGRRLSFVRAQDIFKNAVGYLKAENGRLAARNGHITEPVAGFVIHAHALRAPFFGKRHGDGRLKAEAFAALERDRKLLAVAGCYAHRHAHVCGGFYIRPRDRPFVFVLPRFSAKGGDIARVTQPFENGLCNDPVLAELSFAREIHRLGVLHAARKQAAYKNYAEYKCDFAVFHFSTAL